MSQSQIYTELYIFKYLPYTRPSEGTISLHSVIIEV